MKRRLILPLLAVLLLALGACDTPPSTPSNSESVPSSGSEGEDAGEEMEITLDTHFIGENEDGTRGVYVFLTWTPTRVDYKITEFAGALDNVLYLQEGTMARPEDDVLILERENMLPGSAVLAADESGTVEMRLEVNDMFYTVTRGDTEEVFVLGVAAEDEIADWGKA